MSRNPIRLSKASRELAEQAITALRKLQQVNPFVAAAVRATVADPDFALVPTSMQSTMHVVRCITQELEIRAVHEAAGISQERTDAAVAAFRAEVH